MEAPRATPYGTDSSLRETRRSIASKLLLRVIRHLTRRTALLAIILSCLAALIGVLVGPSTAVGQVMLVAMGIFVSVVVLPEVPYRLWNVKPIDLAETVPSDQLLHASRVLAKAIDIQSRRAPHNSMLPENLITNVWNEALQMLLEIVDDPSKVLCNLEYTARITPATDSNALQRVDTTIRAERHLPRAKGGPVWFSYCSTMQALSSEFDQHSDGCIARELIQMRTDESSEEWFARVSEYVVRLDINGRREESIDTEKLQTSQGLVLRTNFDSGVLSDHFAMAELRIEFDLPSSIDSLPVKFAAYSVVGTASVTIELLDNRYVISYDEYLSPANRNLSINQDHSDRSSICTIRTSGQTVLPVGAGAVFSWKREH